MRKSVKIALAALLAAALLSQTGCVFRRELIRDERSDRSGSEEARVSLDGATAGDVSLQMGAGELNVSGGADTGDLLEGDFDYSTARLAPIVEEDPVDDSIKRVTVRDDSEGPNFPFGTPRFRNTWDIRLTEEVPLRRFAIQMGAGDADIDLSSVSLEELKIELGAGDTTVDLSGERTSDLEGSIQAGAGKVTVRLPRDVGVRVSGAQDGVGEWDADGFKSEGRDLVNDAYGTADVTIELNVQRGIGEVRLELVD